MKSNEAPSAINSVFICGGSVYIDFNRRVSVFFTTCKNLTSVFENKKKGEDLAIFPLKKLSDNPEKASVWLKPSFKNNRNIEML